MSMKHARRSSRTWSLIIRVYMLIGIVVAGPLFIFPDALAQVGPAAAADDHEDRDRLMSRIRASESAARRKAETELARLRRQCEPVSAADLEKRYTVGAGSVDTTRLWVSGSRPFCSDAFDADTRGIPIVDTERGLEVPAVGQPWPDADRARQLLGKYRTALRQLHTAAGEGGAARFPTAFREGLCMPMPDLMELNAATRLLSLEALVHARDGDISGALQALATLFAATRCLETYPHHVAHFVCCAIYARGCETTRQLLQQCSDRHLQQMLQMLGKGSLDDSLCSVMLGERVIGLVELNSPETLLEHLTTDCVEDGRRLTKKEASEYARWIPFVQQRDRWLYLRAMRQWVDAARKPLPKRLQIARDLTAQWETRTVPARSSASDRNLHP